jgi:type IV secretion system protein VirB3
MEQGLSRDPLFVALTRPQMFAGVTYSYFVINLIVSTEFFLIFKSVWAVAVALIVHVIGMVACLNDPRVFDLLEVRVARCPRVPNYRFWRCNSYRA